jgi:hypothetical protein
MEKPTEVNFIDRSRFRNRIPMGFMVFVEDRNTRSACRAIGTGRPIIDFGQILRMLAAMSEHAL